MALYYLIIGVLAALCIVITILYINLRRKLVRLEDDAPKYGKRRSAKLDAQAQLFSIQEKLWPYIKVENGKVKITVLK